MAPELNKEKVCECEGISLLVRMTSAYDTWLKDMEEARPLFSDLVYDIFNHLNSEFNTPKYAEHQEPYKTLLPQIKPGPVPREMVHMWESYTMEKIRTAIHRNPELQQLLTCGPVYTKDNETKSTRIVMEAMELQENATPKAAREVLKNHYEAISCL